MRIPRKPLIVAVPLAVIVLPVFLSIVAAVFGGDPEGGRPFLEMPDPKLLPDPEKYECVRDTDYMRYHHMELLKVVRDEVLRDGIRGDLGLKKCMECHTSRERFCNRCHESVSLYPDCFECHDYP